jgi:hypothetical protein
VSCWGFGLLKMETCSERVRYVNHLRNIRVFRMCLFYHVFNRVVLGQPSTYMPKVI